jgi:hypothetical protein
MKDPEKMDKEEKCRYILEDTSFEGRPRVKWITDCLLGDIRTFLDGIEYFIIQNKGEPAGKSPRGGGNLSVPILINTALEFVAELYTGKTDYMKFNTDINFKKDLEVDKKVSEDLKREFTIRNFPLPKKIVITDKETGKKWEIKDAETQKLYYVVDIKYEKGKEKKLVFHFLDGEEYEATENVKKFILRHFPEKYKDVPLLLWDGIRNGLVHTFSPKPFEYKRSYIRFQFYVEDQNFPSHIEKVKGYLFNVEDAGAKLETDLNRGIVPKELENKFKTMNLPLPESCTAQKGKEEEEKKWEITNGEATLYTLEKEDKEKIIVYSYIIQIRINVFELFRVLEKAVEAYLAELENSDDLQDRFIRAFSSIEDYYRDITKDEGKSKEVKALGSDSSKFLLKGLNDYLSVDALKIYSSNLMIRRP